MKYAISPKTNCFAFNKEKQKCNALSELICVYKENCAFYKHKNDVNLKEIERAIYHYSKPDSE